MKPNFSLLQLSAIILCLLLLCSLSIRGNNHSSFEAIFPPNDPSSFPMNDFHQEQSNAPFLGSMETESTIQLNAGIIPDGDSIQGVPVGDGIFILLFFVVLYVLFLAFHKKTKKIFFKNKQLLILLLCFTGFARGQNVQAQEPENGIAYADEYYLVKNSSGETNLTATTTPTGVHEGLFGQFRISNGRLLYNPGETAGVDFFTASISGGKTKKIAVVIYSPGIAYVGYKKNDGDDNIFNLANAMNPIKGLPANWRVDYPWFIARRLSYEPTVQPGVSLSLFDGLKYLREAELYVDNQLKTTTGNVKHEIKVYSIDENNRHYAIVDKRANRGSGTYKRVVHPASGGTIRLEENYSNSSNYGRFFVEGGVLYYESNPTSEGYGMDMQAFSVSGTAKLAYGVTVAPIDQVVGENGWANLECEDIIKGLPRNYSVRYTYWRDREGSSRIDSIKGSNLKAVEFGIELNGQELQPGQPGHPGGSDLYRSQTYWVKAELYHNIGEDGRVYRATSDPLPLFCYESKYPAWLSKTNYENDLIEITFENPTFSVCPEKSISKMSSYAVETDLEVRVMAYKLKKENGNTVRDYNVPGFDLTSIGKFTGYYDPNEIYPMAISEGGNYPYLRYKVASEKNGGFPRSIANDGVFTGDASYGTRKDNETMALYFKSEINPVILWGNEASGMPPIVLPAQQGELLIKRGICGELSDVLKSKPASLMYRQDFGGYNGSGHVFFNPNFFWDESSIPVNIRKAVSSSTYVYRTYEREGSEQSIYDDDNKGLPYLDEGEYLLTKQTEKHYNSYDNSFTNMWTEFHDDHTTPNNKNDGYMMQVNAGVEKGTFFDYKMYELCKGATMTFTAWIKNTVVNTKVEDPTDQVFEIYDLRTNKLLSRYRTGPILNPGNISGSDRYLNDWKQYGFEFTLPISTDSIHLKILNEGQGSNGNDFAIDDIEVRLLSETRIEMKDPDNPAPCQEKEIEVNVSVMNNDKKFYVWLYSPTNEINVDAQWLELTAGQIEEILPSMTLHFNPHNYTINKDIYPDYPTGYYRFAVGYSPDFMKGNCYEISDPKYYKSSEMGSTYIWTGNKKDGKWKNGGNWMHFYPDEAKTLTATQGVNDYPTHCNDVYIPGKSITHYPVVVTGDACRNIYFFQGGQIQNPQNLDYTRAFVDYNFGQVDSSSPCVSENKTPIQLNYSAPSNNRGQWYTIASPLKQTVAGDFGFAGKPHSWQMKFLALKNENNNISYGQWSGTFNDADIELAVNHNAMALLVGSHVDNYIGLNDHKNIESVDGIIRIPFFSDTHSLYYKSHPLHEYNLFTDVSYFYRYQMENLQPIYENPMMFTRKGEKGYRFVFEDNNDEPLPAYTYSVPAGKDVLIGNPFTSQLDMDKFLKDNESVLASPVYYDFVGSYTSEADQAFSYYVKDGSSLSVLGLDPASRYMPPLKSFVVSTKEGSNNVAITLNYGQTVVTQNREDVSTLRSTSGSRSHADVLLLSLEGSTGSSLLTLSFEKTSAGNAGLLRMTDSKIPSIYAIDPETGSPNMVQFEGGYLRNRIPLGVLAFDDKEQLKIKAFNIDELDVESISLIDNLLNKEIDLKTTNQYLFSCVNGMSNRFELRMTPGNLTDISNDLPSQVLINTDNHSVRISSVDNPIESVEILDLLGRVIVKDTKLNAATVTYTLSEQNSIVIVKVLTADNTSKVQKIILK